MERIRIPHTDLEISRLWQGCMELCTTWDAGEPNDDDRAKAFAALDAAREHGITAFDHADIYAAGRCEAVFGQWMQARDLLREEVVIQSKCGIRFPGDPYDTKVHHFDFSAEHIQHAVEGSLRRLGTDYLDLLLLHRPDICVDPEEVARAFAHLKATGKVRHFGVSNHTPAQIDVLKAYVELPLVANQVRLSLLFAPQMEAGIVAGGHEAGSATRGEGLLEYARLHGLQLQAYGPLERGMLGGREVAADDPRAAAIKATAARVGELAEARSVGTEAIVLAWLLFPPVGIAPVLGSTNPKRIAAAAQARSNLLEREEWYELWTLARGRNLP